MMKSKSQLNYAKDILSEELIDREAEKLQIEQEIAASQKRLASVEEKIESIRTLLGDA